MLTIKDAYKLYQYLTNGSSNSLRLNLKGNIALQKNADILKPLIESAAGVEERQKVKSERFLEFEKAQQKLIEKYSEKDSKGNSVQVQGGVKLTDVKSFQVESEVLHKEYSKDLTDYRKKLEEWEEYVNEPANISLEKFKLSDVEFDKISPQDFEALSFMLEDEELG